MAQKFDPRIILHLLRVCTWKSNATFNFSGFMQTASEIDAAQLKANAPKQYVEISQKYLNDLKNDAEKALENGEQLGKSPQSIATILNYLDFKTWQAYVEAFNSFGVFLDPTKIKADAFDKSGILILSGNQQVDELKQVLAKPEKLATLQWYFNNTAEKNVLTVTKAIREFLPKYPTIIWIVNDNWYNQLSDSAAQIEYAELVKSYQVLPIRIGQIIGDSSLKTTHLNEKNLPTGLNGLLMALAFATHENTPFSATQKKAKPVFGGQTQIGVFNNNEGTVYTGKVDIKNEGGNVAGGNFIQHNYLKGNDDGNKN